MKKFYDLTNPQKSIWYTEQFFKNTNINNVSGIFETSVPVDLSILEKSIKLFVKNNESFRIKLTIENGEIKQYFSDYSDFPIKTVFINSVEELNLLEEQENSKGFELLNSELFKFTLFQYPNGNGGYIINQNHIISDSWTSGIMVNEISKIYDALKNKKEITQKGSDFSYSNYIKTEEEYLNSENFKKDKNYWNKIFETVPEVASIPSINNAKDNNLSYKANRHTININKNILEKLKKYSSTHKISLYNLFMGIFSLYIGRVTNLDEFTIGTPILNRTNFKEKQTTGMFINVLPLKINMDYSKKFNDFVSQIATNSIGLLRHQRYSYNNIIEDLRKKDSSIPNLYDIIISYQITKMNEYNDVLPHKNSWIFNNSILNNLEIHIFEWNDTDTLQIAYDYKVTKYTESEITDIHERILHIINQILENDDILLKEIEIVTNKEKNKILNEFNNTKADYPSDKTISQLFEEQVQKTPDDIALVFENQKLTYKELNEKTNQLARFLIEKGAKPNDVIGIFIDKSLEMVISMFAILKAHCIFLPLDTEYPNERINYIVEDAKVKFILTFDYLKDKLPNIAIDVSLSNNSIYSKFDKNNITFNNSSSEDIMYIIYTSGSTGKPKGVLVKNKNIVRLICNQNFIKFNSHETMVQTGTIAFDACIFEIFGALIHGFKLHILKKDILLNINKLEKFLLDNKITILFLTTGLFNELGNLNPNIFKNLRYLMTGGDVISISAVSNILKACPNINLVNCYGPTENGSYSTCFNIPSNWNENYIPIGKPIANSTTYIVSKDGNLQPIGAPGELWVGGDGIGKGYINRDDLTKKNFVKSPFNSDFIYKTGDLVKYDKYGNICFLNRIDTQIKLRGFRIELGEIDSSILSFDNIKESLTIINKSESTSSIFSYITSDINIDIDELKKYLSNSLPKYMMPTEIIQISSFPININGKIDRTKLPIPNIKNKLKTVKPRNNIDKLLIELLSQILNLPENEISIYDNFLDLGGDSLNAINLSAKIYSNFNVDISAKEILNNPIISDISNMISSKTVTGKQDKKIIEKVKKSEFYPISSFQENIYYATKLDGENSILYNIPGAIIFDKLPNIEKLEECLNKLINRHESFRTYFEIINDNIVQKILDNIDFDLEVEKNLISFNNLENYFKDFIKPFDFSKAPLFHSKLLKINDGRAVLFIDMHHIISDGASMSIFIDELSKLYNGEKLEKLEFDYKDFSYIENKALASNEFEKAKEFWVNQFKDEIPVLNMPTNYQRPNTKSYEGSKVYSSIDNETFKKINNICKEFSVTPYIFLLSIYYILLSKYTGQDDIIVGSPIANRTISEFSNIIGMFVNTLPMRAKINSNFSFKEFLLNIKNICLENYKYQDYPFSELINKLKIQREPSRSPLFDTFFIYQNNGINNVNFNGITSKLYIPDTNISKYDLSLEIVPENNNLKLNFEYCTKLFTKEFIENFANHYKNILNSVLDNFELKIASICVLSEKEKNKILYEFNNKKANYPTDKTIPELFEEQVEKNPDNIAVVFENKELTYKQLNEKSNQLAHFLINNNINKGDIVGIMMNVSLETIISIFGILKAGAAYVLIDSSLPKDRIDYILQSSNTKMLILNNNTCDFNFSSVVNIDKLDFNTSIENLSKNISSKDIFALIYTSGSTGLPKGVLLNHFGFINTIYNYVEILDLYKYNTHLNICNISFDIFSLELFISLLIGKKIIIANEEEQKNPLQVNNLILKHNIEFFMTTPSKMNLLLLNDETRACLGKLKAFLLGGEVFSKSLYINLKKYTNAKIYNGYGPTETSASCSIKEIKNENEINIGKPMFNTNIYILDKDLNLCPIEVPGEIYVSGNGISNGYINNPESTKKAFISYNNTTLYKTGDLGFINKNGDLEYIGRNDFQIKLHGLRIELGEIDNVIMNIDEIIKSVTIYDKQRLISFFISNTKNLDTNLIKNQLNKKLPNYMVPLKFIQVDSFPISSNGKVDLKALSGLVSFEKTNNIILPKNETEKELYNIFCNLLNIKKISTDDSFFDLGGDSLLAIKLVVEISKILKKDIAIKDVFNNPTILELANLISSDNHRNKITVKKIENLPYYELSEIQKNIYYATKLDSENSILYNIPGGIVFEKTPNIKKLENCFKKLIDRHESFRTYFEIENDNIVQKVLDKVDFKIETKNHSISENEIDDEFKNFIKPFDFGIAPLLRSKLVNLDNGKSLLLVDMHHIISDGSSMSIFISELSKLYNDEELEPIEFTYKDFAYWENEALASNKFKDAKNFWTNQFKDDIPVLNIPTTYPRPSIKSYEGANYYTTISKNDFNKIDELTKKLNITPYMFLLSIYYILLYNYSSQNDIIIGTPLANREHIEFSNIIGMFVNTLPLRNTVEPNLSFKEFSNNVKQNTLSVLNYQSYPSDKILKNLNIKRDTSRNPLYDVTFTYQNNGYPEINFKDIKSTHYVPKSDISKFDLSLEIVPTNKEFSLRFEYCKKLFSDNFIKNLSSHYINILKSVLENENVKIADIDMLSKDEKNQILNKFNNTKSIYPDNTNIIDIFKKQVEKYPNKIAVSFENKTLTYLELDKKSNQLAKLLIKNHLKNGNVVGVCLKRSLELIISILGILKAGRCLYAYVYWIS